jgi:hypothetical protein
MKLSTRARRALDELWAVRAECEKATVTLMQHGYRHPTREDAFRRAANAFEQAGDTIGRSLDDFAGITEVETAEKLEREADAEEPETGPPVRRREREIVDA